MALNRLFDTIRETRDGAHWKAAFGEPMIVDERTIIPVARVSYGFGLGFGQGSQDSPDGEESANKGEGGGGGGGSTSTPLGAVVVTPEYAYFEETVDQTKIALAGMLAAVIIVSQVASTLRAILERG